MLEIELNKEYVELANELATRIQGSKSYTPYWGLDNISLGIYGEMAYGIMKGKEINTQVWDDKGDVGADFDDGADIKTISYSGPEPELKMSKIPKTFRAKKLVLAVCAKNQTEKVIVKLIGEISTENFTKKAILKRYGEKSWYAVGPEDLDLLY